MTLELLPGAGYQLSLDTHTGVRVYDDDGPPDPPARTRVGVESGSRLKVRWEADPEASGYEVRWGMAAQTARRTTRVSAPAYTTPHLSQGVQYAFEVSACNAAGCSEASAQVLGSVGPVGTPPEANAGPDLEALPGTTGDAPGSRQHEPARCVAPAGAPVGAARGPGRDAL